SWGDSPVSYRTFKHLLGETSLERKCRFIFGGGIFILVTFSFYWYGQKTEGLLIGQMTESARWLVDPSLTIHHRNRIGLADLKSFDDYLAGDGDSEGDHPKYEAKVFGAGPKLWPEGHTPDDFEKDSLEKLIRSAARSQAGRGLPSASRKPNTFPD